MRIERIALTNYRQFRHAQVAFPRTEKGDLHLVIGTNGTGKTNLLNAINWCLYGEEPHLSKDSAGLPLVNLSTAGVTRVGQDEHVCVEVWAQTEEGELIRFLRKAVYRKNDDGEMSSHGSDFIVYYTDDRGNMKTAAGEEASAWVERFVPKGIREFFFFDGERLDNYFREATGQNIRHAIFEISQIDLLENRVERKLREILDDFRKEAGKAGPRIEEARDKLEKAQEQLSDYDRQIEQCQEQIKIAKAKVAEYSEKLRGMPDVQALEDERRRLECRLKETSDLLRAKEEEKKNLLLESGTILMTWPAVQLSEQIVGEKRRDQEMPPPVDRAFLEEVIRTGTCAVCGTPLDKASRDRVQCALEQVRLSSEAAQRLLRLEVALYQFKEMAASFEGRARGLAREIEAYKGTLAQLTERKSQIDSLLAGYDQERIREWHKERAKFEKVLDDSTQLLGQLQLIRQVVQSQVDSAREELDREIKKEAGLVGLRKKIAFCERALKVAASTRQAIMNEAREKIEEETRRQFLRLVWKKETFEDLRINTDYSITLMHAMGYECLGTISAGERELLALAFTLALHRASGFDSPVFIDTPVARISDANRENFARVLGEVGGEKQIVLLVTPAEFSAEMSNSLDAKAGSRYRLVLSSDETEAQVEAL